MEWWSTSGTSGQALRRTTQPQDTRRTARRTGPRPTATGREAARCRRGRWCAVAPHRITFRCTTPDAVPRFPARPGTMDRCVTTLPVLPARPTRWRPSPPARVTIRRTRNPATAGPSTTATTSVRKRPPDAGAAPAGPRCSAPADPRWSASWSRRPCAARAPRSTHCSPTSTRWHCATAAAGSSGCPAAPGTTWTTWPRRSAWRCSAHCRATGTRAGRSRPSSTASPPTRSPTCSAPRCGAPGRR